MDVYNILKSKIDNLIKCGNYASHDDYLQRNNLKVHKEYSSMYEVVRLDENEQQSNISYTQSTFGVGFSHRDTPSDKWQSDNQDVLDRISPNGTCFSNTVFDEVSDDAQQHRTNGSSRAIDADDMDDYEYQNEVADTPTTLRFDELNDDTCECTDSQ